MSKEEMLRRIQSNKPQPVPLPEIPAFHPDDRSDKTSAFAQAVRTSGGRCYKLAELDGMKNFLDLHFPGAKQIVSMVDIYSGNLNIDPDTVPSSLERVDVAIIYGRLGVVENGAVWVSEEDIILRILPFIAEHLVVILEKDRIVQDMHDAYQALTIGASGFGVFIGGPSKTADIEQSLVVGAQGPRSHAVLLR